MPQFRIDVSEPTFRRDLSSAKKKHPSITEDLAAMFSSLENDPSLGIWIPGLGAEVRKIRLGVKQQKVSARKGYRLVYKVDNENKVVTPLLFHYKPDIELVPEKEILKVLKQIADRQAPPVALNVPPDSIQ